MTNPFSLSAKQISIHVPARGTTSISRAEWYDAGNFNPRPREGDDHVEHLQPSLSANFNPRPREGDDGTIDSRQ